MTIVYPAFFEELLQQDRKLRSCVDSVTSLFDEWLNTSRLPFFADYTDHGVEHLNSVLATACHLMTEAARDVFTPHDAGVLILSVLLHDAALHISEVGFYEIIRGNASQRHIVGFPDLPWSQLWDKFLFSAKRWDDRKVKQVLGELSNGEPVAQVRDPFENYHNLPETDRKLIGEFIRQNHPRLAHEFAVYGIPGKTNIELAVLLDNDLRDIAGLVARSHGLPIRDCLRYLGERYHRREYQGVHAVFLMTLIRVSDYLQIQPSRAPSVVFQYRHIPSKFSELEWKTHQAIKNITQTHDDPEAIEVQANPQDVHTFLRLREWLSGIQVELDASWAVLGETYGSQTKPPKLSDLGMIIRRVYSNIDDISHFSANLSYVPERIELAVARPDLLKLLVGPLYDNIPSIGIRELMQNAIDAVREREFLQHHDLSLQNVQLQDQENEVEIWLDNADTDGYAWLTISDRGTGMTVEIIRDYFLTAGASFRNSDAWKHEYETDSTPHSRVLRSGRFGVGVLAGFLLGNRMEISTRHIRESKGIRFTARLDTDAIELSYDHNLLVGTTIRILVSKAVIKKLSNEKMAIPAYFDWYIYSKPTVARLFGPKKRQLKNDVLIKLPIQSDQNYFRELSGILPYKVYWSYRDIPKISVNGIFINNSKVRADFSYSIQQRAYLGGRGLYRNSSINFPNLCVEDPDGMFPINLRRSDITESRYPFEAILANDILRDFLAHLLLDPLEGWPMACEYNNDYISMNARALKRHKGVKLRTKFRSPGFYISCLPFIQHHNGVTPIARFALNELPSMRLCIDFLINGPSFDLLSSGIARIMKVSNLTHTNLPEEIDIRILADEADFPYIAAMSVLAKINKVDMSEYSIGIGDNVITDLFPFAHLKEGRLLLPAIFAERIQNPASWINSMERQKAKSKKKARVTNLKLNSFITDICKSLHVEEVFGEFASIATSDCPVTRINTDHINMNIKEDICLLEFFVQDLTQEDGILNVREDLFTSQWIEVFGENILPFDLTERRSTLSNAYDILMPLIRNQERMNIEGVSF